MPSITREFGAHVIAPDGGLDRAAMRTEIFSDDDARVRLEAILHPLIGAEVAWRTMITRTMRSSTECI